MKGNDLSNVVASRIIVVFEGLLGWLDAGKVDEYTKHVAEEHWNSAVSCFTFNNDVINRILYLTWKSNYNIHVVTWFPQQAADVIADRLDSLSIPVRSVFSSTPEDMAKMLVYNNDITCIYDPVPQHVLTFGSKGYLVTNANEIGL